MKDLSQLTEAQLVKAYDKASAIRSSICTEMILAGRGYEVHSVTMVKDDGDPLTLRFKANARELSALIGEKDKRMEWHGSLKRIRLTK